MQYLQFFAARADSGAVLPSPTVTVYLAGTSTLATIYNAAGAGMSNPFTGLSNGKVGFRAANGAYDVQITAGTYTLPLMTGVQLYDLTNLDADIASAVAAAVAEAIAHRVAATHEMANAAFNMAGDFGNDVTVTSVTNLTADRILGISRWAILATADDLPLRPANDVITVSRADTGAHWLIIASVDWSTLDNAWTYVSLWGFHPGLTCTTATGSAQITTADTTNMVIGTSVAATTGIPAGALVQSIDSKTQFTMGDADQRPVLATASGSRTIVFGGSSKAFTWTGNGWNRNPGSLELLIAGQTNYTQSGQMVQSPYGAFWSEWNRGSLAAGDNAYNSMVVYPATFPDRTIINWDWPNYEPFGVWGYGAVVYGDYEGRVPPPLGFASTGPKPVQVKDTAIFEAPYAYHVRWLSEGGDWDLLTEYWLWGSSAPTLGQTPLVEVAWTPRPAHYGTVSYPEFAANYIGTWTDKFGVAWFVNGKRGMEIVFSPAGDTYITGGAIDYQGGAAYLISQGQVDGTEWNHGVAFGVEPVMGSGSLQIDRWDPVLGEGKVTPVPGTPAAPSAINVNNLNLDIGYATPANALGCVYTVNGGTTYAGWDISVSPHRTRRLRPGTTYAVAVAGYNDGLRGSPSSTVSMTTTFADADFTSTSIWESALLNDSTAQNHVTVTAATYTLPGGGSATGALVQDVSGSAAVMCDLTWAAALPSLLPGTYTLSVYYNNVGDDRNFSMELDLTSSRYFGMNVEANALAFFGLTGTTDGFYGGSFSTPPDIFGGVSFDGCASNWWRVTARFEVTQTIAAGGAAILRFLNRNPTTGNQYESEYIPDGSGQLGFARYAIQAIDFETGNPTYFGSNLAAGITYTADHATASTVAAWDGSSAATEYLEQAGSGITTGILNTAITLETAAHEYIVCWDVETIGRDFLVMAFHSGDDVHKLDVTWQLSTRQATAVSTGTTDMTCAQRGAVLLAPNRYRLWARISKPAGVTTLALALHCSDSATIGHTGDTAKGFIVQPNTRICKVL